MEYYDFYMSLGPVCRPAYYIKNNNLRTVASPLDWQGYYTLDTVIRLFKTSFASFFENIEEVRDHKGADGNRCVEDVENAILSIHHFDEKIPLKEMQQKFRKTMIHRFEEMDQKLKESKKIAIICNRKEPLVEKRKFLEEFHEIYPNLQIRMIVIRNNRCQDNTKIQTKTYKISDQLEIIQHEFNDSVNPLLEEGKTWTGNELLWNTVFEQYGLSSKQKVTGTSMESLKGKNIVIFCTSPVKDSQMCAIMVNEARKHSFTIDGIAVASMEDNPAVHYGLLVAELEQYPKDSLIVIVDDHQDRAMKNHQMLNDQGYTNVIETDFRYGVYLKN